MTDIRKAIARARAKITFQDYLIVYDAEQVYEITKVTDLEADLDSIKNKILSEDYSDKTLPINTILFRIPSNIDDVENYIQIQLARYDLSKIVYKNLSKEFYAMLKKA